MPIDQVNNFFGIETPPDVKLKSTQMFQNRPNESGDGEVLTEEEVFDKAVHKFFGVQKEKGPSFYIF